MLRRVLTVPARPLLGLAFTVLLAGTAPVHAQTAEPPNNGRSSDTSVGGATAASLDLPLTSAAVIKGLPVEVAGRALPVRLRGVVSYIDTAWHLLFVEQGQTGIFVQLRGSTVPELRPQDLVEIEGVTGAGEFSPKPAGSGS